jgi:tetratricopeptide (TPR) repeat protein
MESELDNLRIAWGYFVERAELDHLLHMIEGMWALQESKGWYRAAIELADDALTVLDQAQPSPELAAEEMALRMSLARAMMAVRGYGVEVEAAFKRALEISKTAGTPSQRFPVLRALATYYMGTGRMELCRDYGAQLLELGESAGDDSMLIEGHYVYGVGSTFTGDFETGIPHLERAIVLHDPQMHDASRFRLGPNTGVVARTALGLVSWQRGFLEQAVRYLGDAFDVAKAIGRPYSLAYALHHNALLALYRGRFEEAIQWSDQQAQVAEINDYPVWGTLALVNRGVALTCLGETEDGLAMSEAAVDLYHGLTAPPVFWPQLLALRALAHGLAGKPETGLELIEEAITIVGPDDLNSAELLVLKGDLLSQLGNSEGAMEKFSLAARLADAGGLNLFALQALTRLVRLQRQQAVSPDRSDELAALYGRFTEGLGEQDLVAARQLLDG